MMSNILFRADSSSTLGTGHIMRDLVLTGQFFGSTIIFATQDLPGNINYKIKESNYKIEILNSNNIDELVNVIKRNSVDMIVIDNYSIDYSYEKELKERTGIKLFVLDDVYEKHHSDILLNHNIYAEESKYQELVPKWCELRCGINFTLLRDEFLDLKLNKKYVVNNRFKVFIAMGGADSKNMNIKILEQIQILNLDVELVTTKANKNLSELKRYTSNFKNINLYIDNSHIVDIIKRCDIAIVTPSVIVNEIVFLKIPFISIMVTDNQLYMYNFLKTSGLPCLAKEDLSSINKKITSLSNTEIYAKQVDIITNLISQRIV